MSSVPAFVRHCCVFVVLSTVACFSPKVFADNWGHWRGVAGNGVAANAEPLTEFGSDLNVKWKVAVPGQGSGSPIVWDEQVFVVSAVPMGPGFDFTLFCYDRTTGDLTWSKVATSAVPHQETHQTNGHSSGSPCTDGQRVYAHFGSRGLFCYTMSGELVWKREDLGKMTTRNGFGEGSSPTLEGNMLLVPWDHEGPSALYALDKLTGKTIWKADRDEPTCWATPLVVSHGGKKQVVMNGQNYARSYDLVSGEELWRCNGQTERPVACPVTQDDMVFVGSGFRGAFMGAFKLGGQGDLRETSSLVWSINQDTPDVPSPILSNGRIYFFKGRTNALTCVDAKTGTPFYSAQRIPGLNNIYASPVAAGGYIYLTDRNGTIVVIKDSNELEVVATNMMGETVDATPAPVGNQLFIRGEQHLFCIAP
jgi:outer membrane protein assembly factor BamB